MSATSKLIVDEQKCTRCGICQNVCPTQAIHVDKDNFSFNPPFCIACGHCVAICPQSALDNDSCPAESMMPCHPVLDEQTAEYFLRSRRSIRCFKNTKISRETMLRLLNVSHYAPTGSNSQSISFLVVDDEKLLAKISEQVICWMEYQINNKIPGYKYYKLFVRNYRENQKDLIMRGAPALVMTLAPKAENRKADCDTALAYLELFAPTLGLGSCWLGLLIRAVEAEYTPLLELLQIPEAQRINGAVLLGYPKYKYQLIPDRKPLKASFLDPQ